jgi:hypothetical protein
MYNSSSSIKQYIALSMTDIDKLDDYISSSLPDLQDRIDNTTKQKLNIESVIITLISWMIISVLAFLIYKIELIIQRNKN